MHIYTHPVGQMQANCYFVVEDNHCIVVDPGDSADTLLEEISRSNFTVDAIVATHGHFDHVMAAGEMQLALGVAFYMSLEDEFLIARLESTARHFLGYEPHVLKPTAVTDIAHLADIEWLKCRIIPTPGHTPGSVCMYLEDDETILTGDTLFAGGIGRYDFSYSDKNSLFTSLDTILKLPGNTLVLSGHGDPTTIAEECSNVSMYSRGI